MKTTPIDFTKVQVTDSFWAARIETNRNVTLPIAYERCKETGRIDAFKWKPGKPNEPHVYWDSDVAKWIEAAAYSLAAVRDEKLEAKVDGYIDSLEKGQCEDGYLNSHFSLVEPEKRWTNLRLDHELYCAGHLMEAAVAYYQATGKRKMLDILCKYADYINKVFGPGKKQLKGYPGHQEIELALVKLYKATNEKKYLELAKFFIDQRGTVPNYYIQEAAKHLHINFDEDSLKNLQAHIPPVEQKTAEGHAVRACYMYAGMADLAAAKGDKKLLAACRKIWKNIVEKRMYITGGIGSMWHGEQFSVDYDLPNEDAYAETCAAISLVFFAHRMLAADCDSQYADVMELALYNGVLSGVSLSGDKFFYANPLEAWPELDNFKRDNRMTKRQEWFDCSCCPTNVTRLLASFGGYIYSQARNTAIVNLYVSGEAQIDIGSQKICLKQKTNYPWDGKIQLKVNPEKQTSFAIALRIPEWCERYSAKINGKSVKLKECIKKGYAHIKRKWDAGDIIELKLEMPPILIEANPNVRQNAGRVAIKRGPLVYCLEQEDNGANLNNIILDVAKMLEVKKFDSLLKNAKMITAKAKRLDESKWNYRSLYCRSKKSIYKKVKAKAIPYFLWAHRAHGQMLVWIRKDAD